MKTQTQDTKPLAFHDEQISNGYKIYRFENFSGCIQIWAQDPEKDAKANKMLKAYNMHNKLIEAVKMANDWKEMATGIRNAKFDELIKEAEM